MSYFKTCPRCNEKSYEVLKTHSFCICCNYSPDLLNHKKSSSDDMPIPQWVGDAIKEKAKVLPLKSPTKQSKASDFEGGAA